MNELLDRWERRIERFLQKKWNLPPEKARKLAVDFSLLLCILRKEIAKYEKLARRKDISISAMFHSLVTCCKCSLSEEEGKSISTGIVIADPNAAIDVLPEKLEIPLPKGIHIGDWRKVRKLCGYVDGATAAFVVEKSNGVIKGARNLQKFLSENHDPYLTITSKIKESVAFLVIRGHKCFRLYSDGIVSYQVILLRKYGEWRSRDCVTYLSKLASLAFSKGINTAMIPTISRTSLEISEGLGGAQFLIADRNEIKSKIASETRLKAPKKILDMTIAQIIRNVSSDGASILSKNGELESVEAKFLATGGRLASIIDMTKSASSAMGIVISMDGTIFVVDKGKIAMEF